MRLTPCLALMILLNEYFVTSIISSTLTSESHETAAILNYSIVPCQLYWWTAIFHIQNYVNPQYMCIHTTWYLSVDFQMCLIAPFFIYLIWKFNGRYLNVIYVFIIASSLYVFIVSLAEKFIVRDYDL